MAKIPPKTAVETASTQTNSAGRRMKIGRRLKPRLHKRIPPDAE